MLDLITAQLGNLSIPVPVTLACACIFAYTLGKISKNSAIQDTAGAEPLGQPQHDNRHDRRTDRLIGKLTAEVENFHRDLDAHTESMEHLRAAIAIINRGEHAALNEETKQTLRSIERHCEEIPIAFNTIRQTARSAVDSLNAYASDEPQTVAAKSSN
jgi:hypothetical protein